MSDTKLLNLSILDDLDHVVFGALDYEESSGNRCSLEIRKDQTIIENLFADMFDDFETFPACQISTSKRRDFIVMWGKKQQNSIKRAGCLKD